MRDDDVIVTRVIERLERTHETIAGAATLKRMGTVAIAAAVLAHWAETLAWATRELRARHGTVPSRTHIRASVQQAVLDRAYDAAHGGFRCATCQHLTPHRAEVHIDHVMPVARGGTNTIHNLRVLCAACNLRKGATP
jgi:5-methylcytosine-specific restriction endonuclease McrA